MKQAYARLHVLLARESRIALVIRHGTAKSVCALLWDREHDRFTLGQWMRGRIEIDRCDLSPSGRHFLYSARRYAAAELYQWAVVSRTPYLKAVAYYPWRVSGGWFLNDQEYSIITAGNHPDDRESPEVRHVQAAKPEPSLYAARLVRCGWTLEDRRQHFGGWLDLVREVAGWELRHSMEGGYALTHGAATVNTSDWEWADVDGERLVWASKGCLWTAMPRGDGLKDVALLHDFNGMQFQAIEAPYEGGRPVVIVQPRRPTPAKPEPLLKRPRKPRHKKPPRGRVRSEEWD